MIKPYIYLFLILLLMAGCNIRTKQSESMTVEKEVAAKVNEFAPFQLETDISVLTENEKKMLPLLFRAGQVMDEIFWMEAYGDKDKLLSDYKNEDIRKFLEINYGPWERLNDNKPFLHEFKEKPAGARFYPPDMTKEEFDSWDEPSKTGLYEVIRRDETGKLTSVPYHIAFRDKIEEAVDLIRKASDFADDAGLKKYLRLRADALQSDDYFDSDMAWLEMKNNVVDFVVGPIETYEDQLFGYKAAHEAYILVKDLEWSKKLEKYASILPELQKLLPCEPQYKNETPGFDSDMNVYDALFYGGDCNAGSKTIAINLPNDEKVRELKGSRKLQLKNSMQAKFDKILVPISDLLIAEDQRKNIKFDAFFENIMFHEVAHGLGLGMTVDKSATVREALRDNYSALEEGKADILGLWCVYQLHEMGEMGNSDLMDNFVTFLAGIFRSVRFGAASAHGKANMIRFYYFEEMGAFIRDSATGTYRVDFDKMREAMLSLSGLLLKIQGDGDYNKAKSLLEEKGFIKEELQKDLDRIGEAGIPRDIVFKQGPDLLGL